MIVKICGLKRIKDVRLALDLGADIVGMIVNVPESPRSNSLDEARALFRFSAQGVAQRALLFRSSPLDEVLKILRELRPEVVHLCGQENFEDRKRLKEAFPEMAIWQSVGVPVDQPDRLDWIDRTRILLGEDHVDRVVLDAAKGGKTGGVGEAFPLEKIRSQLGKNCHDIILAGGLNPRNVGERISALAPSGVDVSSGLESSPGVKSEELMKEFFVGLGRTAC